MARSRREPYARRVRDEAAPATEALRVLRGVGPGKKLIAGVTAGATLLAGGAVIAGESEPQIPEGKLRSYNALLSPQCSDVRLPSGATMKVDLYHTKPAVVSAPSAAYDSRGGTDIDTIVLHHTGSDNAAQDLSAMRDPGFGASAHYLVDRDGTNYQLVDDRHRAWHAGEAALHGVPTDVNSRSIGVEIVNLGTGHHEFTGEQYAALRRLVPYLANRYDVPVRNIVGHKDVAVPVGRKVDPAANFDSRQVLASVEEMNRFEHVA
jgi:hypothetical protein